MIGKDCEIFSHVITFKLHADVMIARYSQHFNKTFKVKTMVVFKYCPLEYYMKILKCCVNGISQVPLLITLIGCQAKQIK